MAWAVVAAAAAAAWLGAWGALFSMKSCAGADGTYWLDDAGRTVVGGE